MTPAWPDGWGDLYVHLVDGTALGVPKCTVLSNRDWSTVDNGFMALLGATGFFTLDYTETAWTLSGTTYSDVSTVAVCAPSGSTAFPSPPYVTANVAHLFHADPDAQTIELGADTTISGDLTGAGTVDLSGETFLRSGPVHVLTPGVTFEVDALKADFRDCTEDIQLTVHEAASEPTLANIGQVSLWRDTGTDEHWLIVRTATLGQLKVQLT